MDPIRLGLQLRALRIRRRWRQVDVAARAGVSRSVVSSIERGDIGRMQIDTLVRVATALEARLDLLLRWHGEQLDRLLDAAHSRLVEETVRFLAAWAWECRVEASFAIGGERGSIDILSFHPATRSLLVIEVKSVVPDVQALLHGIDRKSRLGGRVARDLGWPVQGPIGRLLVLPSSQTCRRRIAAMGATFEASLPDRGSRIRRWIREPAGSLSGVLFVSSAAAGGTRPKTTGVTRVRQRRSAAGLAQTPLGASDDTVPEPTAARGVV